MKKYFLSFICCFLLGSAPFVLAQKATLSAEPSNIPVSPFEEVTMSEEASLLVPEVEQVFFCKIEKRGIKKFGERLIFRGGIEV